MLKLVDSIDYFLTADVSDSIFYRLFGDYVCAEKFSSSEGAMFWTDGKKLLAELNRGALILCGEVDDRDELMEFISFIRPEVIMTSDKLKDEFPFKVTESGYIMSKKLKGSSAAFSVPLNFSMKEYYELFCECGLCSDYQGFMSAMADYIKTGTGFFVGKHENSRLISGAALTGITDRSAVITAIATVPEYRAKHIASSIIGELETILKGRELFIFRERDKNLSFYQNLGFTECGEWYTFIPNED